MNSDKIRFATDMTDWSAGIQVHKCRCTYEIIYQELSISILKNPYNRILSDCDAYIRNNYLAQD